MVKDDRPINDNSMRLRNSAPNHFRKPSGHFRWPRAITQSHSIVIYWPVVLHHASNLQQRAKSSRIRNNVAIHRNQGARINPIEEEFRSTHMTYQHLTVETDARGVARVTLNRPEVKNAFNEQLIADIAAAMNVLSKDASARIVDSTFI